MAAKPDKRVHASTKSCDMHFSQKTRQRRHWVKVTGKESLCCTVATPTTAPPTSNSMAKRLVRSGSPIGLSANPLSLSNGSAKGSNAVLPSAHDSSVLCSARPNVATVGSMSILLSYQQIDPYRITRRQSFHEPEIDRLTFKVYGILRKGTLRELRFQSDLWMWRRCSEDAVEFCLANNPCLRRGACRNVCTHCVAKSGCRRWICGLSCLLILILLCTCILGCWKA